MADPIDTSTDNQVYRVLARKYRPGDFAALVGQEAMVQTLSNAIASGRLAHAFILTGVRGVGKTTTARIIARALNCIGSDGAGGPTENPCGVCLNCISITEDRHVDVLEMDAASRTGVEDIRELIDGVLYRPVSARYKIYIIDEVHMLSRNAFNALLKTLEEPPEHVKFIFATTEIRRVPVTVLSRCQRFDLRRVKYDVLINHFAEIARYENSKITSGAIRLIARAADGSVRDGLSLLDQAIAHSGPDTEIDEPIVQAMLGVAERVQVFDLFEHLMKGEIERALERLDTMYQAGADPVTIVQDLAELTHWLTRLKAVPTADAATPASDFDLEKGRDLSETLAMSTLTRTWQMLLKGLTEVRTAYSGIQAAEMLLVRLAYVADLPSPADMIEAIADKAPQKPAPVTLNPAPEHPKPTPSLGPTPQSGPNPAIETGGPTALALKPAGALSLDSVPKQGTFLPGTFDEMVELFSINREPLLHAHLVNNVHLVKYEIGKISLRVTEEAPKDLAKHLSQCMHEWTGQAWFIEASQEEGEPTIRQRRDAAASERYVSAVAHPMVQEALDAFPGARVAEVRDASDWSQKPPEKETSHQILNEPPLVGDGVDGIESGHTGKNNTDEDET
ncbi:MAG: DNA polymerase III subunit gamma/tau [Pseudomonadota bacterium]|nr:DNA polymerase III subunit gamma/tau [Pseudomonadota bacterium]